MKLAKEEIKFIDNYLKNNNVIYLDIRFEMMDHIAIAVEEKMLKENIDFYNAFKNYMIENKIELMKNNKTSTTFSWVEIKKFILFLVHPMMLIMGMLLFLSFKNIDITNHFSKSFTFNNLIFLFFIFIFIFQLGYLFFYIKNKYYGIEKTGQILLIVYFLLPIVNDNLLISILFLYILLGYLFYFIREIKTFNKHKYNFI